MDVSKLQSDLHEWRERNFPDAEEDQQLLGVVEEVGELAHANLKRKQGIRGTDDEHLVAELDAVGDILIYLSGYCKYRGFNMMQCFEDAAKHVMLRDWRANPHDGTSKTHIRNSPDQDPNYQRLPN